VRARTQEVHSLLAGVELTRQTTRAARSERAAQDAAASMLLESNENDTRENDRMKSLFSLLQSYLLIYKWIQSLPRGVSLGRKVSGEGVDHMLYIFCNTPP
jgi:hypothetical protein